MAFKSIGNFDDFSAGSGSDDGYNDYLKKYGVTNPDDPRHFYDYRGAYDSGYKPILWDTLPDQDRTQDISQAVSGQRTGSPMSQEDAEKYYKGRYMWTDRFKKPGHPVPPEQRFEQAIPDDKSLPETFMSGLGRGIEQLQGSLYGAAGLAGSLFGADDLRDWGFEGYQRNMDEAKKYGEGVTFTQTWKDPGKIPEFIVGTLGELAPSMGEAMVTALIGGMIGSAAAPGAGTAAGGIAGFVGKRAVRKMVGELAKQYIKKGLTKKLAMKRAYKQIDKIGEQAIVKSALASMGAKAGIVAGVLPLEAGGNWGELMEQGIDNPYSALATGTAAAFMEIIGGNSRLVKQFLNPQAGQVFKKAIKNKNIKMAGTLFKAAAVNGGEEFAQEAGQEAMSMLNVWANDPNFEAFTKDNLIRLVEAGGAGLVGGVAGGGGGKALSLMRNAKRDPQKISSAITKDVNEGKLGKMNDAQVAMLYKTAVDMYVENDLENEEEFKGVIKQLHDEVQVREDLRVSPADNLAQYKGTDFDERGSIAGKWARNVGQRDLGIAEKLESHGIEKRRIWEETGWWRGPDGEWRFELDDSNIKINDKTKIMVGESAKLKDVIRGSNILEAYPQLGDINVTEMPGYMRSGLEVGAYDAYANTIYLVNFTDEHTGKIKEQYVPALIHEIQHAIQAVEEFERGGTPGDFAKEVTRMNIDPGKYGEEMFSRYQRLAGEVEARVTQKRLKMDAKSRKQIPPWETMESMLRDEGLLEEGQTIEDVIINVKQSGESQQSQQSMEPGAESQPLTVNFESVSLKDLDADVIESMGYNTQMEMHREITTVIDREVVKVAKKLGLDITGYGNAPGSWVEEGKTYSNPSSFYVLQPPKSGVNSDYVVKLEGLAAYLGYVNDQEGVGYTIPQIATDPNQNHNLVMINVKEGEVITRDDVVKLQEAMGKLTDPGNFYIAPHAEGVYIVNIGRLWNAYSSDDFGAHVEQVTTAIENKIQSIREFDNGGDYVGREAEGEVQGEGYRRRIGDAGGSEVFGDLDVLRKQIREIKAGYAERAKSGESERESDRPDFRVKDGKATRTIPLTKEKEVIVLYHGNGGKLTDNKLIDKFITRTEIGYAHYFTTSKNQAYGYGIQANRNRPWVHIFELEPDTMVLDLQETPSREDREILAQAIEGLKNEKRYSTPNVTFQIDNLVKTIRNSEKVTGNQIHSRLALFMPMEKVSEFLKGLGYSGMFYYTDPENFVYMAFPGTQAPTLRSSYMISVGSEADAEVGAEQASGRAVGGGMGIDDLMKMGTGMDMGAGTNVSYSIDEPTGKSPEHMAEIDKAKTEKKRTRKKSEPVLESEAGKKYLEEAKYALSREPIVTKKGVPFKSKGAATMTAGKLGKKFEQKYEVIEWGGGYALKRIVEAKKERVSPEEFAKDLPVQERIDVLVGDVKYDDWIHEGEALDAAMKQAEKNSEIALKAGKLEGVKKEKARIKDLREKQKARAAIRKRLKYMVDWLKKVDTTKMGRPHKEMIDSLLGAVDLTRRNKKTILKLQATREYMERDPEHYLPDYVWEKLQILDQTNIRELTFSDIEDLFTAVQNLVHVHQVKRKWKIMGQMRTFAQVVARSIKEMKSPKKIKDEFEREFGKADGRTSMWGLIKSIFGIRQEHYDLIIESLAGPNSTMDKVFYQMINEGEEKRMALEIELKERFKENLEKNGFKEKNTQRWLDTEFTFERHKFSRGEKIAVYMHSLNPDNKAALMKGYETRDKRGTTKRFGEGKVHGKNYKQAGEEILAAIVNSVKSDPNEMAWVAAAQDIYEYTYKLQNEVFSGLHGYDLDYVKNYYPKEVASSALGDDEKVDARERFKAGWLRVGLSKPQTKRRVGSKRPIYVNSIAYDVYKSIIRTSSYVGLEVPLNSASRLLYNPVFRNELKSRYGDEVYHEIEKGLRDIAGDWNAYFQTLGSFDKFLMMGKNMVTPAILAVSPFIAMKQIISITLYLPYVKPQYLVQGVLDTIMNPIDTHRRHKMMSVKFRTRTTGGMERDIADVHRAKGEKDLYDARRTLSEKGMILINWGDWAAVTPGMQGAVNQVLDEFKKGKLSREVKIALDMTDEDIAGLSATEKIKKAYKFADYVTEKGGQPMFSMAHRSSLSRGSSIEKMATFFSSFTNQGLNFMLRTYRDARRTGDAAAWIKFAQVVFLLMVVNTAMVMAIDDLRDKLYGRKKKKMAERYVQVASNLSGFVYFLRDLVPPALNKATGQGWRSEGIEWPIMRIPELMVDAGGNGLRSIFGDSRTQRRKAAHRAIDSTLALALMWRGLPYSTPKKLAESIYEQARRMDAEELVAEIMNRKSKAKPKSRPKFRSIGNFDEYEVGRTGKTQNQKGAFRSIGNFDEY